MFGKLAIASLTVLCTSAALAHHSYSMFDMSKDVTLPNGTVLRQFGISPPSP
jgi:uncharacterized protein DUF6152